MTLTMEAEEGQTLSRGWAPLVERTAAMSFRPDLDAPHDVRAFVADAVRGWGFGDLAESAELLVSEIVTNVVLHARTTGTATVDALPAGVRVSVSDSDPTPPERQPFDAARPSGRGLDIVSSLARRWGVDHDDDGSKVVWFELDNDVDALWGHR